MALAEGSFVGVAQLSDPHLTSGVLSAAPAQRLHTALGSVLGIDPRPAFVVITGDLTEHGRPEEYAALRDILDGYPLPVHLLTGNHDSRTALIDEFGGTTQLGGVTAGTVHYRVCYEGVQLAVLDSKVDGSPGGSVDADQLAWLADLLAARPAIPTLVAVHHPPIAVGVPLLDGMRLDNGPALADIVGEHPHVVRVLCGHVHRPITAAFAGTVLTVAPSTYQPTTLTLRPEQQTGYLDDPSSYLLHLVARTAPTVTHVIRPNPGGLLGGY